MTQKHHTSINKSWNSHGWIKPLLSWRRMKNGMKYNDMIKIFWKGLLALQSKQFTKLEHEPTNTMVRKVWTTSQKMGSKITEKVPKKVCPTESALGRFYGKTKMQKLLSDDLNKLPWRLIVFKMLTTTYETANYLAKLLFLLDRSKYNFNCSNLFVNYYHYLPYGIVWRYTPFLQICH